MNLIYSEQRVNEVSKQLSILHSNEKDKEDIFFTKTWESYWHRKEYSECLGRLKKGEKNKKIT